MELVKKNDELEVEIIDYGANGEGIAKIDGYTIFVIGALKNEKCKIHITKVLKSHAFAKVVEIIEKSKYRVESDCKTFPRCGGCALRHISYDETLKIKQENVQNLVNKMMTNKIKVSDTIGMEDSCYYRNKAIYPVSKDGKVGIFAARSHEVIPFEECKIQTKYSQEIAKYVVKNWNGTFYNEETCKGTLRNIMIREGFKTGEVMLVLVENGLNENALDIEKLVEKFPRVKTVIANINKKNTNVVLSYENKVLFGDGVIEDYIGEYKFKISANSFYQVNPVQTEKIYNLAIEKARLNKEDVLCDLYCGIGTIGIFASKYVKKVYGIEIVPQAIIDAKENAKLNNVENAEFIEGDVEKAFDKLLKQNVKPNVVIVDPPRKGMDEKTISNLNALKLERLVYVSCNPATLVRDLELLSKVYKVENITPVDNFCYSTHVENIAVLSIKN